VTRALSPRPGVASALRGLDAHLDFRNFHSMPVAIPFFVLDLPELVTVARIVRGMFVLER